MNGLLRTIGVFVWAGPRSFPGTDRFECLLDTLDDVYVVLDHHFLKVFLRGFTGGNCPNVR